MENVSEHQLFSVKNNSSKFLYTTLCVNALTVHIASCVYFFCNVVCTHDGRGVHSPPVSHLLDMV